MQETEVVPVEKKIAGVLVDESVSPPVRTAVAIQFYPADIHIKPQENSAAQQFLHILPLAGLQFEIGGNRNSLLFVKSSRLPRATVYCEATSSNLLPFQNLPGFQEQFQKSRTKERLSLFMISMLVAAVMGVFAGLIYFRGPIFGGIGANVPFSWEQRIGEKAFARKLSQQQQELQVQLADFLSILKFDQQIWSHPFVFHLTSEETPNAMATLGGHVFVTKGLFQIIQTPEELLGVVAHEMIHIQRRHVARSMFQALGMFGVVQLLFGDVTGVLAVVLDQGGPLLNLQFSRELEEEADELGLQLLVANQINPIGLAQSLDAIRMYQKKIREQQPGSEILEKIGKIEILMSHPEVEKRIENLRKRAQTFQGITNKGVDRSAFVNLKKKSQEVF